MNDFMRLPDVAHFTLHNVAIPSCLLGQSGDFTVKNVTIKDGGVVPEEAVVGVDCGGRMLMACFTDMHTHLDKGHIAPRAPNPDGTFMGALDTVRADREARWTSEDVRRRMDFALRCAYAHGTCAIRTHLDSLPPQDEISWPVFAEMRAEWAGRIDLQASCLVPIDMVAHDGRFARTADLVAEYGGVLGAVAFPAPDLSARLKVLFEMAEARGLSVDLHVDETGDSSADALRQIAQTVIETGFKRRVVVGHCCSLSVQGDDMARDTIALVAEANLKVVSLPMCNLYLQDRHAGRTPRWRGITLVHEMETAGIDVAFASDNTRDPFYAYGDLDMVEVIREATRIGHLDHSSVGWPLSFGKLAREICQFDPVCRMSAGQADFVIFNARNWTEFLARPQSDRIVVRAGRQIERCLPSYSELDDLMEVP